MAVEEGLHVTNADCKNIIEKAKNVVRYIGTQIQTDRNIFEMERALYQLDEVCFSIFLSQSPEERKAYSFLDDVDHIHIKSKFQAMGGYKYSFPRVKKKIK